MSLRARLFLVVALAALALGAAGLAIVHLLTSTDAAREHTADATMETSLRGLTSAFDDMHVASLRLAEPGVLALRTRALSGALLDADLGFCTDDGALLVASPVGRRGEPEPPGKPLPHDQQDAVIAACRAAGATITRSKITHPHDVVHIATRRVAPDGAAWVLLRVPTEDAVASGPWRVDVGLLSVATLALVVVTASAATALRRGVEQLQAALARLREDLDAALPPGETREFAELTSGLGDMAKHLAAARERERSLMKDLSHRERLAALGRVVAGAAHEIRNPLAGIKLKLDVMARAKDTPQAGQAAVRSCLEEVERLDRVVRSLLVVARKPALSDAEVDLGLLADERARLLDGALVRIRREGTAFARIDHDGVARVLDNLIRNALEASPGELPIVLSVRTDGDDVVLDVIDRGSGVPDTLLPELFEPFSTTKSDGTGLGLWLSRALVEAQGGSLVYERSDDKTVFRLRLPKNGAAA